MIANSDPSNERAGMMTQQDILNKLQNHPIMSDQVPSKDVLSEEPKVEPNSDAPIFDQNTMSSKMVRIIVNF